MNRKILITGILVSFGMSCIITGAFKSLNEPAFRIGKQYVLVRDTVTIVDYQWWNSTYVGDNGKAYSRIFVEAIEDLNKLKSNEETSD